MRTHAVNKKPFVVTKMDQESHPDIMAGEPTISHFEEEKQVPSSNDGLIKVKQGELASFDNILSET